MTKLERLHYDRLARLGCIVCRRLGYFETPAEIHHVKIGITGVAKKSHYLQAIPLCPEHHRLGPYGVAYHAGPEAWERNYGTQAELLARATELLDAPHHHQRDV